MNIFELAAKLSLDSSEYEKELDDSEKKTSEFGNKLKSGLKVAAGAATVAITGATTATVTLTKAFVNAAKATAEEGDAIDKNSQKIGFSKKAYQEWDYVLNLAGSSMQSASMGIKTMTNQVDKAKKGNKEAVAAFKSLGISVKDLKTSSREEIFEKLIEGLQKMPESANRAALANKLLGRSGQELTPLFNQSSEATKNLIKQANDLGIVMDDKAVKASANFKDSLTTLKGTVTGLKNAFMSQFLPSLTSVADGLAKVFGGKTQGEIDEGVKLIEYGMRDLANKLVQITPQIVEVGGKIIKALVEAFVPMLPTVISALFSLLTEALKALVSMLPQLMPAIIAGVTSLVSLFIQILPILIDAVLKIITALAEWLAKPENAALIANGIVQMITSLANTISTTLPILLPAIVKLIGEVAKALTEEENLKLILTAIWEIIKAIGTAIIKSIPILLEALGTVIGNLFTAAVDFVADQIEFWVEEFKRGWKMFTDAIANAGKAIVDFFTNIKNKIVDFFTNIRNKIVDFFTGIKEKITSAFNNIKNFFAEGFNNIRDGIKGLLDKAKGFFGDLIEGLKDLPRKAIEAGKNLVGGIIDGVKSMIKKAVDAVKNLGKNMLDGIKGFFKIKSPSQVMRDQVGKFLALGIGEGFTAAMPKAVAGMVAEAKEATKSIADVISAGSIDGSINGSLTTEASGSGISGSNYNFTVIVNGTEGQDIRELAKAVSEEIQNLINDKEKVYA